MSLDQWHSTSWKSGNQSIQLSRVLSLYPYPPHPIPGTQRQCHQFINRCDYVMCKPHQVTTTNARTNSHTNKTANLGLSYQLFDSICLLILLTVHSSLPVSDSRQTVGGTKGLRKTYGRRGFLRSISMSWSVFFPSANCKRRPLVCVRRRTTRVILEIPSLPAHCLLVF